MKDSAHSTSVGDIVLKVDPMCSAYQAPSYEPNFISLVQFLPKSAYLSMLFFLELAYSAGWRINNMLRWATLLKLMLVKVKQCSYGVTWCTEHSGAIFVMISPILMEWDYFFLASLWHFTNFTNVVELGEWVWLIAWPVEGYLVGATRQD